jgi:tRNA-dihydrouridine synthase B
MAPAMTDRPSDLPAGAAAPDLRAPLIIGDLQVPSRVMMAPMAGITTMAFRRSVRRWGAGLVFTEMISACGIHYRNRRTIDYLACDDGDHPIGFQLFGADPAVVAEAALVCVTAGADLVDINMACPVRKVLKTGAGAALLGDPARAEAMVEAVVDALDGRVPVTVKLRSGLRSGDEALCLHPRSAAQLYRGAADHALTRSLAAELPVPVIASGDIDGRAACLSLLRDGIAAVMLARHAVGRPWLFDEVLNGAPAPAPAARLDEVRAFAADVEIEAGARATGHLRQFWPRLRRAGALDRALAHELMRAPDMAAVRCLLAGARPAA